VPIIYGCGNCLIKRPVFARLASPAFDLRFNFLGGGDVDFFTRCRRSGMKFHWVAEAVINETVPDNRTRPSWLALRGLRIGAINYHVQRKAARTPWLRARLLAKMLALLPLSLIRAIRLFLIEHKPLIALHPVIVAIGSALAAIGIEPQPYKASKIVS
jgi:GT2 family glycosyltransferase